MKRKTTLRSRRIKRKSDFSAAMLFMFPSLAGIILFFLYPFSDTIRRSFFDTSGVNFVFLENYKSVFSNESFKLASINTAKFICVCIPVLLVISLALALLTGMLRGKGKGFKIIYLLPMAVPVASMVLLWQMLFHDNGLVNSFLESVGIKNVSFMSTNAAFWVLIGTYVWKNMGYNMILWLSGLDGIPVSLYEAARVDGAGALKCFRYITLPSLMPTLGLAAVISLLNSFKVFREAYLVGGSYPHDSIYMLQHLFNNWFTNMDISRLCAAAVILCLVLLAIILFLNKYLKTSEE